jgi:hypothetical protein
MFAVRMLSGWAEVKAKADQQERRRLQQRLLMPQ